MIREFIGYAKCGTCQKAQKWLKANGFEVEMRDIVSRNPSADELSGWIPQSGLPVAKFFNTSGLIYKERGLKDVVKGAPTGQLIELLSAEGKLVKRPLLLLDNGRVLVGFNESEWTAALGR